MSKRKLMLAMNLMMKRGKLIGKSLGHLLLHRSSGGTSFREHEFSCANSPNPVFFHANSKRKHSYFPCINAGGSADDEVDTKASPMLVLPRIGYSPPKCTELASTPIRSPFSVQVSNFWLAEEGEGDGLSCVVDDRAEEFIRRFYQQLQAQGRLAVVQCQEEEEYEEMLARGV